MTPRIDPRDPERERADERKARQALYGPQARPSSHLIEVSPRPLPTFAVGPIAAAAGANARLIS